MHLNGLRRRGGFLQINVRWDLNRLLPSAMESLMFFADYQGRGRSGSWMRTKVGIIKPIAIINPITIIPIVKTIDIIVSLI